MGNFVYTSVYGKISFIRVYRKFSLNFCLDEEGVDDEGVDEEEEAGQESDVMSVCAESQEELSRRVRAQATKAMASFKQKASHKRVSFPLD